MKPTPNPDWGRWREQVVTNGTKRNKARTIQTEVDDNLRVPKEPTEDDDCS